MGCVDLDFKFIEFIEIIVVIQFLKFIKVIHFIITISKMTNRIHNHL